jgi:predicted ATP-dependent protease
VGQEEAMRHLRFGLSMRGTAYKDGHYHVCVVGEEGSGRLKKVLLQAQQAAAEAEAFQPDDTILVADTENLNSDFVIRVPGGTGAAIAEELGSLITYAFDGLRRELALMANTVGLHSAARLSQLKATAELEVIKHGWRLVGVKMDENTGMARTEVRPADEQGKTLPDGAWDKLAPEAKAEWERRFDEFVKPALAKLSDDLLAEHRRLVEVTSRLDGQLKIHGVTSLIRRAETLGELSFANQTLARFMNQVVEEIVGAVVEVAAKEDPSGSMSQQAVRQRRQSEERVRRIASVRVLVDNAGVTRRPVVHAADPVREKLFGYVRGEPVGGMDATRTDHTTIEAGALFLKAHQGTLVVVIDDMLEEAGGVSTFREFLRTVRTGTLRIRRDEAAFGLHSRHDYQIADIPVDVKVVAVCSPALARVLRDVFPDFENLFRVTAEFESDIPLDDAYRVYGTFVQSCVEADGILPVGDDAVARLLEWGARTASSRHYVSSRVGRVKDLLVAADYWAKASGDERVERRHVQQVIDDHFEQEAAWIKHYRRRHVDNGMLALNLEGERIGSGNAMGVLTLSDEIREGVPMMLTCRSFASERGVILVQREIKVTDKSTDQSVETIIGYLLGEFGADEPLTLGLRLAFEQVPGIGGNSAGLMKLAVIMSCLAKLPVDQMIAGTGAVSQFGQALPVGGVTHKFEGHLRVLRQRGVLRPGHGAFLPRQNLDELVLSDEFLEAAAAGLYRVFAVEHVDEVYELLMRRPAAEVKRLARDNLRAIGKDKNGKRRRSPPKPLPER